jgi:hypothetical protein
VHRSDVWKLSHHFKGKAANFEFLFLFPAGCNAGIDGETWIPE